MNIIVIFVLCVREWEREGMEMLKAIPAHLYFIHTMDLSLSNGPPFLLLDEVIAYTAVIVIVSGSDGRKHFWSQLNNSKTVKR